MRLGINRSFGQILKKYRELSGKTQQELADYLRISRVSVANYESGKQSPPLEQVVKAAIFLEFSLDELKELYRKQKDFNEALLDLDLEFRNALTGAFEQSISEGDTHGRAKKKKNRANSI